MYKCINFRIGLYSKYKTVQKESDPYVTYLPSYLRAAFRVSFDLKLAVYISAAVLRFFGRCGLLLRHLTDYRLL